MYLKRLMTSVLAICFFFTAMSPALADNSLAMDRVAEMEKLIYGVEQEGSLVERTNSLEEEIMGTTSNEAILTKIDRLYNYLYGSYGSSQPSFLTKLNVVEWSFTEQLTEYPIITRLDNIEVFLNGQVNYGSLNSRINSLMQLAFNSNNLVMQQVVLPKDLLIKISINQTLNSKTAQEGEEVTFRAEDNIYVGNYLVIPKGAVAHGKISKVSQAKSFGRNANIKIDYTDVQTIDNTQVPILVGKLAEEATKSMAQAAGASMAGMIILGPIGIIGGVFVKGKDYNIPQGAVLYVQVSEDILVNGVQVPNMRVSDMDGNEMISSYSDGGL